MTENHPITPPKHLLSHWEEEINYGYAPNRIEEMLTEAARWGADQELEACINAILVHPGFENPELFVELLRTARRPKPPSLQDQALDDLERIAALLMKNNLPCDTGNIRRALESLPE